MKSRYFMYRSKSLHLAERMKHGKKDVLEKCNIKNQKLQGLVIIHIVAPLAERVRVRVPRSRVGFRIWSTNS